MAAPSRTAIESAGSRVSSLCKRLWYVACCSLQTLAKEGSHICALTNSTVFITTAFQFYVLQLNIPSASNFKKVRDDAFSQFWTKVTGRHCKLLFRFCTGRHLLQYSTCREPASTKGIPDAGSTAAVSRSWNCARYWTWIRLSCVAVFGQP